MKLIYRDKRKRLLWSTVFGFIVILLIITFLLITRSSTKINAHDQTSTVELGLLNPQTNIPTDNNGGYIGGNIVMPIKIHYKKITGVEHPYMQIEPNLLYPIEVLVVEFIIASAIFYILLSVKVNTSRKSNKQI